MKILFRVACVVTALAAAGVVSPAGAQTAGGVVPPAGPQTAEKKRPTRGLFAPDTSASSPSLVFDVTLTEAYDDDVTGESGPAVGPGRSALSGYYSMLLADVDYNWRGRHSQFGATASSALRYYQQLKTVKNAASSIGLGFSTALPKQTTWSLNQTAAYSPSYLYGLFPSGGVPIEPGDLPQTAAPNYTLNTLDSYSYGTTTTLSHGLTRRGSLSLTGDYLYTDFAQSATQRDVRSYGVRAQFSRNMTRNTTMRLAYRYRGGDIGFFGLRSTTEHGVDVGVDATRPLSATRRATFGFTVGSSAIEVPTGLGAVGTNTADTSRLYRVSGDVSAGYQFRRTWLARATYRRSLEYVPALTAPVFANATNASLSGLFSRRVDFDASAGYSSGKSVSNFASNYDTYTGDVRVRYALNRNWALFGEYLYYYYNFRGATLLLLPGMAPGLERNGVRAGITLRAPALGR